MGWGRGSLGGTAREIESLLNSSQLRMMMMVSLARGARIRFARVRVARVVYEAPVFDGKPVVFVMMMMMIIILMMVMMMLMIMLMLMRMTMTFKDYFWLGPPWCDQASN